MFNTNDIPRATGLIILEVRNSNPNGDPERDGAPRRRRGDIGEISPVSVKRKMRDLIANKNGPIWLYLQNKYNLDESRFQILEDRGRKRDEIKKIIIEDDSKPVCDKRFVKTYWDGRVFGNTFLEGIDEDTSDIASDNKAARKSGQDKNKKSADSLALKNNVKTGVVHFGLGLSVAPVSIRTDFTQTNKSGVEEGKTGGMAPGAFKFVEHGIYTIPFFVNPTPASKTGCSKIDVDVALELIPYVYSHNPSTVRTQVEVLHAWYAEHMNQKGSFNDFKLIDILTPYKESELNKPSSSRTEYIIPNPVLFPDIIKELKGKVKIRDLMDLMKE